MLRKAKLGFLFQSFNLLPYLTVLQNVQIPMLLNKVNKQEQKSKATQLLNQLELSERLDHKPCVLSVGQQQRVAYARMLINDPDIILADEPTGNLDPQNSERVLDFLMELNNQGKTIILVTHDMKIADRAKRILNIRQNGEVNAISCNAL